MKPLIRQFACMLVLLMVISCGPSKYTMYLDVRHPSKSGVNLSGKNISVVYLENGEKVADGFNANMADGFAYSLENDYGMSDGSIGIFRMQKSAGGDYSSKDTLVNLLIDTGCDVLFLFDSPKIGEMTIGGKSRVASKASPDSSYINSGSAPYTVKLYCYDAMNSSEEVKTFGGTAIAQPAVYSNGRLSEKQLKEKAYRILSQEGWDAGVKVAASFESQWKTEGYSITYFDNTRWMSAVAKADQLDWKGAMEIWFEFLGSKDIMKRSCAAYNLAVSCFILGDYKLAESWLDLSDSESELPLSSGLRKRIEEMK